MCGVKILWAPDYLLSHYPAIRLGSVALALYLPLWLLIVPGKSSLGHLGCHL